MTGDEALTSTARQDPAVRWLILFKHHPLYSSTVRRLDDSPRIEALSKLIDEYRNGFLMRSVL